MTEKDFVFWLQGFIELTETDSISDKQWLVIKDHLKLVFDKVTPVRTTEYNPTYPPLKKLTDIDWTQFKDTKIIC